MKQIFVAILFFVSSVFIFNRPLYAQYDPHYPDLQIWDDSLPYSDKFVDSADFNQYLTGLLPGQTRHFQIKLTNRSYGGDLPLNLSINIVSPQLSGLGVDASHIKVRFTDVSASTSTSWYSLHDLLSTDNTVLGFVPINQGEVKEYQIDLSMDSESPVSLQNLTINDIKVKLFGTSGQYQDIVNINYIGFATGTFEVPPTATPTPEVAVNNRLLLIPLCSPKPSQYRVWKAINLSNNYINVNWSVPKISKSGNFTLQPQASEYFKIDAYKNINMTKFSWNNHEITLYSLPLYCSYDFLK